MFTSILHKDFSLSNIFIVSVELDRLLQYAIRRIQNSEDHLIVSGLRFSGKTAFVKVDLSLKVYKRTFVKENNQYIT